MIKSQPVRWLKHFSALEQSWFLITPLTLFCLCWSIRSLEPEHYGRRDFRQPWHPWWLCLLLKHRRFGTKDTRLFYYSKIFADLRFVWFGSDRRSCEECLRQYLLGIQRYIQFDRPPRQLLGRMAPASSSRDNPRSVTAVPSKSCGKFCACHRVHHTPCPHRRSCGSSAKWGVHILHINSMLTYFTYICIFCAYKCIWMQRRNTYRVTACFCIFYAYLCIFNFACNGIFIIWHISAYYAYLCI